MNSTVRTYISGLIIISWTIINVITGKAKEKKISPLMYVLTVLFILKYVFL